jgi:hypothetical protein
MNVLRLADLPSKEHANKFNNFRNEWVSEVGQAVQSLKDEDEDVDYSSIPNVLY